MNYLGHVFLSFDQPELLVGNIIGDYVKGSKEINLYPENIQKGIWLHRKIDEYTDNHIANSLAKNIFRPHYHLYAGAIVDVIYDYFLANDPRYFATEAALLNFSQTQYKHIDQYTHHLPETFLEVFEVMKVHNWLYNYRTVKGIEKALVGLNHKAKYMENSNMAYQLFIQHYYELNQRYYEFIDDIVSFVKKEIQ